VSWNDILDEDCKDVVCLISLYVFISYHKLSSDESYVISYPSTFVPSLIPSVYPSLIPSVVPSKSPLPSLDPTQVPSIFPSLTPSIYPSIFPSILPTTSPSIIPSSIPSIFPSILPTDSGPRFMLPPNYDSISGTRYGDAICASNTVIVVGGFYLYGNGDAAAAGAAYVFDTSGNFLFNLTAFDDALSDWFGDDVACTDTHIAIGSPQDDDNGGNSGSVYVYLVDGTFVHKLVASVSQLNAGFGGVGLDSNVVTFGHTNFNGLKGRVYVFDIATGTEQFILEPADLTAPSGFGRAIVVKEGYIVVGAHSQSASGSVYVFTNTGTFVRKLVPHDSQFNGYFGGSVDISNGKVAVGSLGHSSNTGAVYIYNVNDGSLITQISSPSSAGQQFGNQVRISDSLDLVVVAAYIKGEVYFYQINGNYIGNSGNGPYGSTPQYGRSLAIIESTSNVLIGAPLYTLDPASIGAVFFV